MKKYDDKTIQNELKNLPGWEYSNGALERNFVFADFKETIMYMVRISYEAESINHHPDWTNGYNKLNIRLSTHAANGITERDFMLAKRINELIEGH